MNLLVLAASVLTAITDPVLGGSVGLSTWDTVYASLAAADEAADAAWRTVTTEEAFEALRKDLRAKLIARLGGFPSRTPLAARTSDPIPGPGYSTQSVAFESVPGVEVTATLYLPDPARFTPPHPAAIGLCGHSADGRGHPTYRRAAVLTARTGVAALMIDPIGQGERRLAYADAREIPTRAHVRLGVNAELLGHGLAAFMIWDAMRGIDYLETRPDIRHGAYGAFGNSGGGTQSAILSALDGRVRATATSCFLSTLRHQTRDRLLADSEQLVFGQLADGVNHAGYALLGGHPVFMLAREGDMIPFPGTCATHRLVESVGRACGRPDGYPMLAVPGPHGYTEETMRASAAFLAKRLRGADVSFAGDDGEKGPDGPHVRTTDCVERRMVAELDRLRAARKGLPAAERAALVRRLAGVDPSRVGDRTVTETVAVEGGAAVRGFYSAKDGLRLPFVELVPSGTHGAPVLLVGDGPRDWRAEAAVSSFAAGHPVLIADVSATGEIGGTRHHYENPHDDEEIAKMLYLLGETLVGRRAGDIAAIAADLRRRYGPRPVLVAQGRTAVAAAHAAAAESGLFASVRTVKPPSSWEDSVRTAAMSDYATLVPGALRHYDWPELLPR